MLKEAIAKADNILTMASYYAAGMITKFAEGAPEEVRAMFPKLLVIVQ